MKISVTNIGPIKKADIDLAPLVIFVGQNNAGKSLLATVLYAVLSGSRAEMNRAITATLRRNRHFDAADDTYNEVTSFLGIANWPGSAERMPDTVRQYFTSRLDDAIREYMTVLPEEIAYAARSTVVGLRRATGKRTWPASIRVTSQHPSWQATVRIGPLQPKVSVDQAPNFDEIWNSSLDVRRALIPSVAEIIESLLSECFRETPAHTTYLPAARSGILQSYRAITASVIRRSSRREAEYIRNPPMSGVVADFVGGMVELDPHSRGEYADEADRLEQEVLHGSIHLQGEPVPEVVYHTPTGDYQIGNTSSMVSELAPVVLHLRHELRSGDLLLIEEPEAHLHPGTQVAFASCLVRLVNRGLKVGLTTHSEFFLQQVNNAIMAGVLSNEDASTLGVWEDRIDAEKVAAYFFDASDSGTTVKHLPIDPKQGIPEASFDTVTDQLYDQIIALDRRIGAQDE